MMSKHIQSKTDSAPGDDAEFDSYFPFFVFALRDFSQRLEIGGRSVTADEYMEHCLTVRESSDPKATEYNKSREYIRKYFLKRRCFTFDRPASSRTKLWELEKLKDSDLSDDFVEDTRLFLDFIFQDAPVKELENGRPIKGGSK